MKPRNWFPLDLAAVLSAPIIAIAVMLLMQPLFQSSIGFVTRNPLPGFGRSAQLRSQRSSALRFCSSSSFLKIARVSSSVSAVTIFHLGISGSVLA
jgi:hypothetical protein